jgi:hypothetical protein
MRSVDDVGIPTNSNSSHTTGIIITAVHMREQRELKISLLTKDSREGK